MCYISCVDLLPIGAADMYTGRPLTVPMSFPMPNGIGAPPPAEVYAGSLLKLPPPPQSKLHKTQSFCYLNVDKRKSPDFFNKMFIST